MSPHPGLRALAAAATLALSGCAAFNCAAPDSPVAQATADASRPPPQVAVRAARQAGARFIIAVDVSARAGKAPPGTAPALLARDAQRRSRIDPETRLADVLIRPDMDHAAGPRAAYFAQAQAAGEAEARARLAELTRKLTQAGLR